MRTAHQSLIPAVTLQLKFTFCVVNVDTADPGGWEQHLFEELPLAMAQPAHPSFAETVCLLFFPLRRKGKRMKTAGRSMMCRSVPAAPESLTGPLD